MASADVSNSPVLSSLKERTLPSEPYDCVYSCRPLHRLSQVVRSPVINYKIQSYVVNCFERVIPIIHIYLILLIQMFHICLYYMLGNWIFNVLFHVQYFEITSIRKNSFVYRVWMQNDKKNIFKKVTNILRMVRRNPQTKLPILTVCYVIRACSVYTVLPKYYN